MRPIRALIGAVMVLVITLTTAARGDTWDVDAVYAGGFAAGDTSLALDNSGVPSVSYTANGTLYVDTKTVSGWTSRSVAQVGWFGGLSSLAFNAAGQPGVAFIDTSNPAYSYVKYASKPAATWTVDTTVLDDAGWLADYVSLAYNPSGQACIAYCKTVTMPDYSMRTYVCFRRRAAANVWTAVENILDIGYVTGPSMVIGGSDDQCITFADSTSGQLKFASRTGTSAWQVQGLDGSGQSPVVGYTSVTLQPNGSPAVAYFRAASGAVNLCYASKSGAAWAMETVATLPGSSLYDCSLAIASSGTPMILYYDAASDTLKHAWRSDGAWHTETVDSAPSVGLRPSLKLDALGNASASFFDSDNHDVKFAAGLAPWSMAEVKAAPDGRMVRVPCLVASTAHGEIANRVYAQSPDRSMGIGLHFPTTVPEVARGMLLDVQGPLATINGERVISSPTLTDIGDTVEPKPLGMGSQTIGGGCYRYLPGPPATGQLGVLGAAGTNNIGLLVRTWGRYTYVNLTTFTVTDGSGATVKCIVPPGVTLSQSWNNVAVTGASSCELSDGSLYRVIRVRNQTDITPF